MMTYIAHSTHDDEARFIITVSDLITQGDLPAFPAWESGAKDKKARLSRKKKGEKEAKEAEKLAKELGVWDEFYGSGETGRRKGKGKERGRESAQDAGGLDSEDEKDHSALQALMLKKRQKNMNMGGFFDSLAAKYADPEVGPRSRTKGKKRVREGEDTDSKKKPRTSQPIPEINDEEFDALQKKLFGEKGTTARSDLAVPTGQRKAGRKVE